MERYTYRKSPSIRITLAFAALAFLFAFMLTGANQAWGADESISLGKPSWNDTNNAYTLPELTVTAENAYTTAIVSVDAGYMTTNNVDQSIVQATFEDLTRTTYTMVFKEGTTIAQIQEALRAFEFHLPTSGAVSQKPQVKLSTRETILPNGATVTAGTGTLAGHYYMYVPGNTSWDNAYNTAKTYKYMGMKGYLVTITSSAEDTVLDNITNAAAWSGGTRALISGVTRIADPDTVDRSTFALPSDISNNAYYWTCGPEAGTYYTQIGYYSWNSGEPNNAGDEAYMEVHHNGARWNDRPIDSPAPSGYFVEFGGYGEEDPGYSGGTYSEIISDEGIVVVTPVAITGITASAGHPLFGEGAEAATMTVAPSNATFVTYQWYRSDTAGATSGGTAIEGATESSYAPTSDDEGYYLYCIASGELDSSAAAALTGKVLPITGTITYAWKNLANATVNNATAAAGSTWEMPTNPGATFVGWYLEDEFATLFADASGNYALASATEGVVATDGTWEIPSTGITLYPKWDRIGNAESIARMFVAEPQNGSGDGSAWESDEISVAWNDAEGRWDVTLKQDIEDSAIVLSELQEGAGVSIGLDMNDKSIYGASSETAAGTPGITLGDRVELAVIGGRIQGGDGTTGADGISIAGAEASVNVGIGATIVGGASIRPGGDSGSGIGTAGSGSGTASVAGGEVMGGVPTAPGANGGDGISGDVNVTMTDGWVVGGDGAAGQNGSNGGNGGNGINTTLGASVSGGEISGGDGGDGGDATGNDNGGNGGSGGTGIIAPSGIELTDGEISGGSGGNGGSAENGDGGAGGLGGSSTNGTGGEGGDGGSSVTGNGGNGGNGGASSTGNGGEGGDGGSSTDGDGGNGGAGGTSSTGNGGTGGAGGNSTNGSAGTGGNGGTSISGETGAGGAGGSSVNGSAGAGGEGSPVGDSGSIDYTPAEEFVNTYLKASATSTIYANADGDNYAQIMSGSDAWNALSEVQQARVNQMLAEAGNGADADTYPEILATATAGDAFVSLYLTDDEVIYSEPTAHNHTKITMGAEPWQALSAASQSVVNGILADNGNAEAYDTYPEMLAAAQGMENDAQTFLDTYLTGTNGIYKSPTAANNAQLLAGKDDWTALSGEAKELVNQALAENGNAEAYDTYPEMLDAAKTQAEHANAFINAYLVSDGNMISEPSKTTAAQIASGGDTWSQLTTVEQELVNAALAANGNAAPYNTYEGLYTPSRALAFVLSFLTEADGSTTVRASEENAVRIASGEAEWTHMSINEQTLVNRILSENGNAPESDTYPELLTQANEILDALSGIEVYRLYNPGSGDHLYTTSAEERQIVIRAGWRDEGVAFVAPSQKGDPVYRVYNPVVGGHHYTTSAAERDALVRGGWNDEGVAFLSADPAKGAPVRRLYNPNPGTVCHLFTTSLTEASNVEAAGWRAEGIAFYALS